MTEESPQIDTPKSDLLATPAGPLPAAADMPLLRIEGVGKTFGNFRAVDRLSLDIRAGEFFALLGPSGCGKTTLLRMLAGFETPDEGRILLDGNDIASVLPHERPVNMMFQNYALFPHLSVRDNIAFGLKRARLPRAEVNARVAEMVALPFLRTGRRPAIPALVMGGGVDAVFPPSMLFFTTLAWRAQSVTVPGCGHMLMLDRPWPQAAEALAGWLETTYPARSSIT